MEDLGRRAGRVVFAHSGRVVREDVQELDPVGLPRVATTLAHRQLPYDDGVRGDPQRSNLRAEVEPPAHEVERDELEERLGRGDSPSPVAIRVGSPPL